MFVTHLQEICLGLAVWEQCTRSTVVHSLNEWESDLRIVELFNMWASAFAGSNWFDFDDLQMEKKKLGLALSVHDGAMGWAQLKCASQNRRKTN